MAPGGPPSRLRRLARTSSAYLVGSAVQKVASLLLLPLYTRYLTRSGFGAVEVLLQTVIGVGVLLRFGVIEAVLRFYHRDTDDAQTRWGYISVAMAFVLMTATAGTVVVAIASGPLSRFLLGHTDHALLWIAAGGLWVQCVGELALAVVRLHELAALFLRLSLLNLIVSVAATLALLLGAHLGPAALLLGNFIGNAVMVAAIGLVFGARLRPRWSASTLRAMLQFGGPTMPAEVSVFLLTVIDRIALVRISGLAAAGVYSLGVKVSQVTVFFAQAFYQAWPPFAYSITDDREAARIYGLVTYYVLLFLVWLSLMMGLTAPWVIAVVAGSKYAQASPVIPLVSFASSLYCVYLSLMVVLGRIGRTTLNFPLTVVGTIANLILNLLLIPRYGPTGAGVALAAGYLIMLIPIWLVVRRRFPLRVDWLRLVAMMLLAILAFTLGTLLPDGGAGSLVARTTIGLAYGCAVVLVVMSGDGGRLARGLGAAASRRSAV